MDNIFYKKLLETSPIGYAYQRIICDDDGTPYDYEFLEVNDAYEQLTGLSAKEIINKRATEVLKSITEQEIEMISFYADVAINGGKKEIENFSEHTNTWHKIDVNSIEKNYFVTFITDTCREFSPDEVKSTPINYEEHLNDLQTQLERLDDKKYLPLTLILVDINGLKLSIDAFGQKTGELIIERVEKTLKKECGEDDIVSQIGSDEFILLLTKSDTAQAEKTIKRINFGITMEKVNNFSMSVSIGFAIKQNESDDMNDVFNRAEEEMYRQSVFEGTKMKRKVIDSIMDTLFERSKREMVHSRKVSKYCVDMALRLGFSDVETKQIRLAGLMHNIGKIGNLSKSQGKKMMGIEDMTDKMQHPELGRKILGSVSELADISTIVLEHHERWDGKGYPRGLKGEQISISARIVAVADMYAMITTDRPFMKTLEVSEALAEIKKSVGTLFDPIVANNFIEMIREETYL